MARSYVWWIDRYRKSTAYTRMTLAEQGAYKNIIDELVLRDGLIENDEDILAAVCGRPREWKRVRAKVLARLTLTGEGWRHETVDELRREARLNAGRQAKHRNGTRNGKRNGDGNGESDGEVTRPPNSYTYSSSLRSEDNPPPPSEPAEAAPAGAECVTADWLAELWLKANPTLQQPRRPLQGEVKKSLQAAAKRTRDPEVWRERFRRVNASDWLSGRSGSFRASILWAIGPKNVAKIDAGQYENHAATAPRPVSYGVAAQNSAVLETLRREAAAAEQGGETPW